MVFLRPTRARFTAVFLGIRAIRRQRNGAVMEPHCCRCSTSCAHAAFPAGVHACALCRTLGKWRSEFCAVLDANQTSGDDGSRAVSRQSSVAADLDGEDGDGAARHQQVWPPRCPAPRMLTSQRRLFVLHGGHCKPDLQASRLPCCASLLARHWHATPETRAVRTMRFAVL